MSMVRSSHSPSSGRRCFPPVSLVLTGWLISLVLPGSALAQNSNPQIPLPLPDGNPTARGMEVTVHSPGQDPVVVPATDAAAPQPSLLAAEWKPRPSTTPGTVDFQLPGLETLESIRPQPAVRIQKFIFTGNKEFTDAQLEEAIVQAIGDYPNRDLRTEDLEAARMAVTLLYIKHEDRFVNSGALLGDQEIKDGTLEIRVIEGVIDDVEVWRRWQDRPLKGFAFSGNTAIPTKDLETELERVLDGATLPLSAEQTSVALEAINALYRAKGFIETGALIPELPARWNPILRFRIHEGRPAPSPAADTFQVRRVSFEGNEAFSDEDLRIVLGKLAGPTDEAPETVSLTREDLAQIQQDLNRHYASKFHVSDYVAMPHTGVLMPAPPSADGVLTVKIIEGTRKEVAPPKWMRDRYYTSRLKFPSGGAFNLADAEKQLELLTLSPHVGRINAEVKPGTEPGHAILELIVREVPPFHSGIDIHNHRPVSVGSGQVDTWLMHESLLGLGDRLYLSYGLFNDGFEQAVWAQDDNFAVDYRLPVTPFGTTLFGSYAQSSYAVIQEPFSILDIEGESRSWKGGFIQPVLRSKKNEVIFTAALERVHNNTTLLDIPFGITPGADNGEIDVSVLRATLDWVNRSQHTVLALRGSVSTGVNWFGLDNTDLDPDIDDQFVAGQLQGQFIWRFEETNINLLARAGFQVSDSELFAPLQLAVGGSQTVRGYRENSLVRDAGFTSTVELHWPLWYDSYGFGKKKREPKAMETDVLTAEDKGRVTLTAVPFVDFGGGWNSGGTEIDPDLQTLYSLGAGLIYSPTPKFRTEIFWGHDFVDLGFDKDSLQDLGIHVQTSIQF